MAMHTRNVITPVTLINLVIILFLNIAWILVCMKECYRTVNRYLTCKRTPNLHPIYKDVQYLSRQRNLYNLETHIVKYVLVILCMTTISKYESQYPNCHLHVQTWKLYSVPLLILSQNINFFFVLFWFVLISIVTRYLAARYLNHSFYRTLYRYIVWISVQFCIVAFCSSKLTFIFRPLIRR